MLVTDLPDRKRRFCEEYVIDFNGTRAAIAAGYSENSAHVQASQMLNEPQVMEYLQYLKTNQTLASKVTREYVLEKIVDTLERCAQEVEPYRDRKGQHIEVETKDGEYAKAYVFDSRGVLKATELLGKHLAMFTDVSEQKLTFTQMPDVKLGTGNANEPMKALDFDVGGEPNAPIGK